MLVPLPLLDILLPEATAAEAEAVGEFEAEVELGGRDKVSGFMSSVAATALSELNSGGVAA